MIWRTRGAFIWKPVSNFREVRDLADHSRRLPYKPAIALCSGANGPFFSFGQRIERIDCNNNNIFLEGALPDTYNLALYNQGGIKYPIVARRYFLDMNGLKDGAAIFVAKHILVETGE